jgi:hypothetical protein
MHDDLRVRTSGVQNYFGLPRALVSSRRMASERNLTPSRSRQSSSCAIKAEVNCTGTIRFAASGFFGLPGPRFLVNFDISLLRADMNIDIRKFAVRQPGCASGPQPTVEQLNGSLTINAVELRQWLLRFLPFPVTLYLPREKGQALARLAGRLDFDDSARLAALAPTTTVSRKRT